MSQFHLSIGFVTVVFGDELLHITVDQSRRPPTSFQPSLHPRRLWAKHLTIPLKPQARGPKAGYYWVHLKYGDDTHQDVAWLDPNKLGETSLKLDAVFRDVLMERLSTTFHEIDAKWLASKGYMLTFMWDDEFPVWAETYFKQRSHRYRVSEDRIKEAAKELWIAEPEILNAEDFVEKPPQSIQAFSLDDSHETLSVRRFPWGPDGAYRWYAIPTSSLSLAWRAGFERILRLLGPGCLDVARTILIELGIPADFDRLDQFRRALEEGKPDVLNDLCMHAAAEP